MHGVILFAEAVATLHVFRDCYGGRVPQGRELVRKVVDVDGAVRAEVVVESEKNVAHLARRL